MSDPLTDEDLDTIQPMLLEYRVMLEHRMRVQRMTDELRSMRAWKARLGDPQTWFPSLKSLDELDSKRTKNKDDEPFLLDAYIDGARRSLSREARALVERAKEDAP